MTTSIDLTATCDDDRPISALADLIANRQKVLGETTRDAAIATIITALKSLRAATRKNRGGIKKVAQEEMGALSITVTATDMHLTWQGNKHKTIVEDKGGQEWVSVKPWIRVPPSKIYHTPVFRVILSNDRVEAWKHQKRVAYIAATDIEEAKRLITARYEKVASKGSGLAKDALSHAMHTVSSRPVTFKSKRSSYLFNASGLVKATVDEDGFNSGSVDIEVQDNLRYATDALTGGEPFVATALARAANSVNGYLHTYLERLGSSKADDFAERPFPESAFDPESGLLL